MGSVSKLTKLVPALALAAGIYTPNLAQAADLYVEPPIIEVPEVKASGGWYLRGDITYDFHKSKGAYYHPAGTAFEEQSIEDSWDFGLGVGYQINHNFRVDVTGDYVFAAAWRGTSWDSNFVCPGLYPTGGGTVSTGTEPGTCRGDDSTSVSIFKLLGNAYVDLGHWSSITPYVGAGIGGAYVMYDDLDQVLTGVGCCGATYDQGYERHNGRSSWRFAYALHAGVSYELKSSWKLDLGYSYTSIAGGAMADYVGGSYPQAYDEGFTDHVIHAGLRDQIW